MASADRPWSPGRAAVSGDPTAVAELRRYPYLGAPDDERNGHRKPVKSGYRIIYRVSPDTGETKTAGDVIVVAIFGPGEP